jgi:hypothetical protein
MSTEKHFSTSFMWDGERIEIQYRPPTSAEFDILEQQYQGTEYALHVTLMMLMGWNIEDDEGKVAPITYDQLADFPLDFLQALNDAIVVDFRKRLTRRSSAEGRSMSSALLRRVRRSTHGKKS